MIKDFRYYKWYKNWKLKRQIRKQEIELLAKRLLDQIIATPDFEKGGDWIQFYYRDGIFYHTYMVIGEGGGGFETRVISMEELIKICYRNAKTMLKEEVKEQKKQIKMNNMKLHNKTQIELVQLKGGLDVW